MASPSLALTSLCQTQMEFISLYVHLYWTCPMGTITPQFSFSMGNTGTQHKRATPSNGSPAGLTHTFQNRSIGIGVAIPSIFLLYNF